MRIAVAGRHGQIASSLIERGAHRADIVALGRPQFDLENEDSVARALLEARPDVIVNAAAYTAVDKAESDTERAQRVNCDGAGFVAQAAHRLAVPLLHLSTDYVYDGALERPYREDDPPAPLSVYGRSKLAGEERVASLCQNSVILRTAWVYSPFADNFVRKMLQLGETRAEVSVVADQRGNPTSALDVADALIEIAARLRADRAALLRGVFHITGSGEASWADVAQAIFERATQRGRAPVLVKQIKTSDYPTAAKRPHNSRLDNAKLRAAFGVALPDWRDSLASCVDRLLS